MVHPLLLNSLTRLSLNSMRYGRPALLNTARYASSLEVNDHKVGDIIHGYKLEQIDYIKELNIKPYLLRHETTGAEHLHLHKDGDSNNVFAVSLRTTPKDSTGVAHILEHLALSGSKKYPIKEPFFKMLTRSLATFMNAMTGPDFTVYPFSTQNPKDFENLLNIYADAVFFPRLRPVDFRQEAWRLEHEKPDKKETPIVLRGVVYNEMKGVFSSSSAIYGRQMLNNLFPDTTYRYESGGDPQDIPSLSHDGLKKFHKLHYHPSNAKFYTYGDIPLEHHLKLINEAVMSKFGSNTQAREQSVVQEQEPWKEPKTVSITCPPDPMSTSPEKQTTTSVSYMLPTKITHLEDMFALQILSELLISGPNAPFYKSLIESGLGAGYSPSTGLDSYTKQPYFSIGLKNIQESDISKVHGIIEKTFKDASEIGFPSERVDAILHDIELGIKHISGNFGLRTLMSVAANWNHDGDVVDSMRINKYVENFKQKLSTDQHYWSNLIKKNFLTNNHKLILNMSPDPSFEEKRSEQEKSLVDSKIAKLTDVDRQTVLYEGMELQKIHNTKEDVSILPCLEPSKDISRDLKYKTELKFESHKGVNLQICEQPTNEVVYFRAMTEIGDRLHDANLIDYLPLFCGVATKLGAGTYDRHKFSQKTQLTTGGLGVSLMINPSLSEFDNFKNVVLIGSQCLRRNVDNMFDLWSAVFEQIHIEKNKEYLSQLVKASAAELASSISFNGNSYASRKAASGLSNISALEERLSGLTYIARIKDMAAKEPIDQIALKLQAIASIVFDPFNMKCAINAEPMASSSISDSFKNFIDNTQRINSSKDEASSIELKDIDYEKTKVDDMKFPFATHYVAKSFVTVPKSHPDFPKLVIMSQLISSRYLLPEIREKGGAYGASARMSSSGILNFSSYRDPNTTQTLKVFDFASRWIDEAKGYTEKDIEESKLGVFQKVDAPVEPGKKGLDYFVHEETDDIRRDYRERLLDVSIDDVKEVSAKYLNDVKIGTHVI